MHQVENIQTSILYDYETIVKAQESCNSFTRKVPFDESSFSLLIDARRMHSTHPVDLLKRQLFASIQCIEQDKQRRPEIHSSLERLQRNLVDMLRKVRQSPIFDAGSYTQGTLSSLRYMRELELRLPFPKTTLYFKGPSGASCILAEEMSPLAVSEFMQQHKLACDALFEEGAVMIRGFIQPSVSGTWHPVEIGLMVSRHWLVRNDNADNASALEINALPFPALPCHGALKSVEAHRAYTLLGGLIEFCEALAAEDLRTDQIERTRIMPLQLPVARKNEKTKQRKWRPSAQAEHKVIHLGAPRYARLPAERPGLRNSPCEHYRRGHLRRIGRKNVIWVKACLVGHRDGSLKAVPRNKKDYIIRRSL